MRYHRFPRRKICSCIARNVTTTTSTTRTTSTTVATPSPTLSSSDKVADIASTYHKTRGTHRERYTHKRNKHAFGGIDGGRLQEISSNMGTEKEKRYFHPVDYVVLTLSLVVSLGVGIFQVGSMQRLPRMIYLLAEYVFYLHLIVS